MERLVFNTKEHKLEELEKYGFEELIIGVVAVLDGQCELGIYTTDLYGYTVILRRDRTGFFSHKLLSILYDLIKDGLVVKEKQNEDIMC